MLFKAGSEVVLQVFFRQFLDSSEEGKTAWTGRDADGVQTAENVIGDFSIQVGKTFELSVNVYFDLITVSLNILVLQHTLSSPFFAAQIELSLIHI